MCVKPKQKRAKPADARVIPLEVFMLSTNNSVDRSDHWFTRVRSSTWLFGRCLGEGVGTYWALRPGVQYFGIGLKVSYGH